MDPGIREKGGRSLPSLPLSSPLDVGFLKPDGSLGSAVSCPIGIRGGAPAKNEFGALYKVVKKATGGNHFKYHVLQ